MLSRIKRILVNHIKENTNRYFWVFMAFVAGVSAGAFTVNGLSTLQSEELINYFQGFLHIMDKQKLNSNEIFMLSLQNNMKLILLLWVLGVTIIGIPFIFLLIIIRGFVVGFTSGFIINFLGIKGAIFNLLAVFPKEFIIIPCIIALGVNGINFSLNITKSKSIKQMLKYNLKADFLSYSMTTVLFSILIIGGLLIEAYIVPVFIRIIIPIINT
ncbi:MAG TPA: stage II sporulation protein M [Clostridiaceae bacterium]|nr:stage II sporulation protein M [Clostridiaceae bacterium]